MFEAPKLKVKRANRHIDELNACLSEFVETDFCSLAIEEDAQGHNIVRIEMRKNLPCEVPLMIGDAIHNLHSALDITFCDLVRMSGETPDEYTKFVFRDTRDNLVGALKQGKLKAAKAGIIDVIADTIKPYKGGNDALYALHDIDILDKHLLLVPAVSLYGLHDVSLKTAMGGFLVFDFMEVEGGVGPECHLVRVQQGLKVERYGKPAFSVEFGDVPYFKGRNVVPSLHQLSQLVFGVIATIENKCK